MKWEQEQNLIKTYETREYGWRNVFNNELNYIEI